MVRTGPAKPAMRVPWGALGHTRAGGFQWKDVKHQLLGEFFIIKYILVMSLKSIAYSKILRIGAAFHVG